MNDSFDLLIADGLIDEVLGRLKTGKEAEVWLVRQGDEVVAAKLYKNRESRSFKNNAGYTEGRQIRNSRTRRAIAKGSRFGRQAAEEAWKEAEANALYALHAAGVRVPTPVLYAEGVLLMELVLGADGHPAPRLIDVDFTPEQARAAYADLRQQVVRMLCCDLIHGDLSPYNVLWGAEGPTIIDLPQTIAAAVNNRSFFYFQRDLENLRRFFASFDRSLHRHRGDARAIWTAYERRELEPDFVPEALETPPRPAGPETEPTRQARHPDGSPFRDARSEASEERRPNLRDAGAEGHSRPMGKGRPQGPRQAKEGGGQKWRSKPTGHGARKPSERGGARGEPRGSRPEFGEGQSGGRRRQRSRKPQGGPEVVHVRRLVGP